VNPPNTLPLFAFITVIVGALLSHLA